MLIESAEIDSGNYDAFLASLPEPIPTLVLTNSRHQENHQKYLELGVDGIFSKEKNAEALFKAIKQVSCGDLWFQRRLMGDAIKQLVREKKAVPAQIYSYNCAALTGRDAPVAPADALKEAEGALQ